MHGQRRVTAAPGVRGGYLCFPLALAGSCSRAGAAGAAGCASSQSPCCADGSIQPPLGSCCVQKV